MVVLPAASHFERRGYVADLLYESQGARYRPKAVVLVEAVGGVVNGIDHDEPRGDGLRGDDNAGEGIGEERPTKSLAMQRLVQGEPGEQNSRDLARVAAPQRPREVFPNEKVRSDRVIPDDLVVLAPDERAPGSACFCCAGVLPEPVVKIWLAAVEECRVVAIADRFADERHTATAVLRRCVRDGRQP